MPRDIFNKLITPTVDAAAELWVAGSVTAPAEITSYGTSPACRDLEWYDDGYYIHALWMIRTDSADYNYGTAGLGFTLPLPATADTTFGDSNAQRIGSGTLGYTGLAHAQVGVHLGNLYDTTDGDYCYLISDGLVAVLNNTFTDCCNFHIGPVKYKKA